MDPLYHRKTCRRFNRQGDAHYLTFSCYRRQKFLSRDRARRWFIEALNDALAKENIALFAYVLMPEHVHLLVWPRDASADISRFLKRVKLPVARRAVAFARARDGLACMRDEQPNGNVAYRFWQRGGGYDRNIYTADELWEKIHYIHNNPVRRGLVALPHEFVWSSAQDYAKLREPPIRIDFAALPPETH